MAEEKKKAKRPTALKRDIQNVKRREVNKAFKSRLRTTVRSFEEQLKSGDNAAVAQELSAVYGMMDKGVKRGVIKLNKAKRIKSRYAAQAAKQTA